MQERGLDGKIECDSAGTSSWHIGDRPDPRTIETAVENGIKLDHLGRQVEIQDLYEFDYIVAMDESNREDLDILSRDITGKAKIVKMRDFDGIEGGGNVPDPYYGGQEGFQVVFDMLSESCDNFIDFLIKKHGLK